MNNVMSRSKAASLLMDIARRGVTREQVEALQLGVRTLVKRHFDCMKNKASRKAKKDGKDNTDGK